MRQREIRQQGKTVRLRCVAVAMWLVSPSPSQDGYESLESLSVSYSSRSSRYYGDGLDEPIDSVTYVPPRTFIVMTMCVLP